MFISNKEKESIKRDLSNLWNNVNTLYEGKRQMNGLFAKDHHDTVRPKVDMLSDLFERTRSDILDGMSRLFIRIEKLEKNAVKK